MGRAIGGRILIAAPSEMIYSEGLYIILILVSMMALNIYLYLVNNTVIYLRGGHIIYP